MAFTVRLRLVVPLPPTICSFSTTWMPSALMSTVFGAGEAGTLTPTPESVAVALVRLVEPEATSGPPHGPSIVAVDCTSSAFSVTSGSSPTICSARLSTVDCAEAVSVVWTGEVAVTRSSPVLRIEPVATVETDAEAALLLLAYGGGAAPETVGSGPLEIATGGPISGASVRLTDSPNAELVAEEKGEARAGCSKAVHSQEPTSKQTSMIAAPPRASRLRRGCFLG